MSALNQMAKTLATINLPAWGASDQLPAETSRTERIRQLLKSYKRPSTAEEIAFDLEDHMPNFGPHLVWLLLKYEIQKGRVIFADGKYRWNHEYDAALATSIRNAVKLLKQHGYKVTCP